MFEQAPSVILHSPQLGENIGAAARVMLNFGLRDLRLVAPRDGWPNPAALPLSAGALEAGVEVTVYDRVEGAIADLSFLGAVTARPRGMEKDVIDPREAAREVAGRVQGGSGACGLIFGAESHGLPSDVVALANVIVTYPVNPAFASLNLAQAVAVFCSAWGEEKGAPGRWEGEKQGVGDLAPREDLIRMFEHFEDELERAGYFYPPDKTPLMKSNLRNAFVRGAWTLQEVRTFRGAIKALALGRGKARVGRGPKEEASGD